MPLNISFYFKVEIIYDISILLFKGECTRVRMLSRDGLKKHLFNYLLEIVMFDVLLSATICS